MDFKKTVKKTVLIPAIAATAVLTAVMWPTAAVSATSGDAVAGAPLPTMTLAQNSSYVSNAYSGVLHVNVGDSTVACASADSQNRLVVTAVGTGSTTITFWYKQSDTSDWVSTSLPVTVTEETSSQSTVVSAGTFGITFTASTEKMPVGSVYTPSGIKLDGYAVAASTLLWISSNDSVVSVDKSTGTITGVGRGIATVYAVDPSTKYCGSYTVSVS